MRISQWAGSNGNGGASAPPNPSSSPVQEKPNFFDKAMKKVRRSGWLQKLLFLTAALAANRMIGSHALEKRADVVTGLQITRNTDKTIGKDFKDGIADITIYNHHTKETRTEHKYVLSAVKREATINGDKGNPFLDVDSAETDFQKSELSSKQQKKYEYFRFSKQGMEETPDINALKNKMRDVRQNNLFGGSNFGFEHNVRLSKAWAIILPEAETKNGKYLSFNTFKLLGQVGNLTRAAPDENLEGNLLKQFLNDGKDMIHKDGRNDVRPTLIGRDITEDQRNEYLSTNTIKDVVKNPRLGPQK